MRIKNIHEAFEALTPTKDQKEKIFQNLLTNSQINHKSQRRTAPIKLRRYTILAAVLMVGLTTTAFAAIYTGLDEALIQFLKPSNKNQVVHMSNGAFTINKIIKNKQGSLTIRQVIGDSNLTYILMDFTAPKGTDLNAARYRFHADIDSNQSSYSTGYEVIDDGNPYDNKISLVMNIMTNNSLAGQTVDIIFRDLEAADPFPGIFDTVVSGSWETSLKLDFKEYSTLHQINQAISLYGYKATLKTISVSPISITLKIESDSLQEINKFAFKSEEIAPNIYLDDLPITINFTDGTSETTRIFTGMSTSYYTSNQLITLKTFDRVINDKEIESFIFFGKKIPIKTTGR
ncbi:hypothetical protein MKZ07_01320 [Paenibacillus sp. FSL P4-0338]|uniref:hypothetical protein n=1 Tax=Paenibacillus sp. FSL P4-0338 TaxID=2921635 RepID=UPI0030F5FA7F